MKTIDEIRAEFRAGKMSATEALKALGDYAFKGATKVRGVELPLEVDALVGEILGRREEPEEMSDGDRQAAESWERSRRE
jgi:hypothetical protein